MYYAAHCNINISLPKKINGFTLIELIVVIVIIGVLAVAAIPRMFDRSTFDSRGFYDETISALRYAQKAAIAQRRTVCATFTATSLTLTIASAASSATCDTPLANPVGGSPFTVTPRSSGIAYSTQPTDFTFNALGQASGGQTVQITGASSNIVIEQDTGYVHS
ncbi:prepilin-type N-terminal cleavage/methylation domain-containing protein [Sulfuriferula sp. AH1]|uniref:prepilin-type N-terminal cleavage/methylation domain-containing protein n=1 Tax=Sulfuriferula sp. AH1 TaxID=1985873 RepID=UPI000B3B4E00|nr:prepilin-type N-terminal cleavage/methylation domain-containing protein [Sulfuriferula sp. AH1]